MSTLPSDLDLGALLAEHDFVRRLARSLVHNADDAEDVAQLTWLQALRQPWQRRGSARAFLGQVTRHVASNVRRADARRVRHQQAAAHGEEPEPAVADAFARESLRQQVVAELAALSEPYRRTLVARFFDELPPHAIAQRESCPDATVRARLKRGLELLRERLDRRYGGDRSAWCTALLPLTRAGWSAGATTATAAAALFGWKHLVGVGALGVAFALGYLWLGADPSAGTITTEVPPPAALRAVSSPPAPVSAPDAVRVQVADAPAPRADEDDAPADNGLCGRLLFAHGEPATQRRVELVGLDPSRLFDGDFAKLTPSAPFVAMTTHSDGDGRFRFANLRPRALLVLQAARGERASACLPVTHTAGAQHVVDLGDIVLQPRGSVRGRAVDEDGEPVAGALVWAADMPGLVTLAVNVDRFAPAHGGMLLLPRQRTGETLAAFAARTREYLGSQLFMQPAKPGDDFVAHVLDSPPWLAQLWDALPMARTTTAADGTFTLHDVEPGNNMLVLGKTGFDRGLVPTVKVNAGDVRDVGDVTLAAGETLLGRVVAADGQPVAGAAVRVCVLPMAGFRGLAFSEAEVRAGADGKFRVPGVRQGKVLVAARAAHDEPWKLQGPLSTDADVEVILPARAALSVRVRRSGPVVPQLQLTFGPDLGELARLGLRRAVAIDRRVTQDDTAVWHVHDLVPGSYQLAVSAEGHVTSHHLVQVPGDIDVALTPAAPAFDVLVVSTANSPIRGARVRCAIPDQDFTRTVLPTSFGLPEMHALDATLGCTGADGKLAVRGLAPGRVTLWADHPAHGVCAMRAELPAPTVMLRLAATATLTGTLLESGAPAAADKWRIAVMPDRRADGIPRPFALAGLAGDGTFKVCGLEPGAHTVKVLPALAPRLSLTAVQQLLRDRIFSFFDDDSPRRKDVVLEEGETRQVQLDVSVAEKALPSQARVRGRVTVNGAAAAGISVHAGTAWFSLGKVFATTDNDGTYTITGMTEGSHTLHFLSAAGHRLGTQPVTVGARGDVVADFDAHTSSLAGRVIAPAERTLQDVLVHGRNAQGYSMFAFPLQADGTFHATGLPSGTWHLTLEGTGIYCARLRAEVTLLPEQATRDVKIVAEAGYELEVRVEASAGTSRALVVLRHVATNSSWYTMADQDGLAHYAGLPGGTFRLEREESTGNVFTVAKTGGERNAEARLSGEVELSGPVQHKVTLTARGVIRRE